MKKPNCPWGGLPCDCTAFPWTWNGLIPQKCEDQMPDALLGIRKVSAAGKARYQAYLAELEENRRKARSGACT
jgi:hypothetical protein